MTTAQIDEAKVEEFVGKVLGDVSATTSSVLAGIGERLGLWKDLATGGPATSEELARRTGIHLRYAREWLEGMTAAGYLVHEASTGRFSLPAEHHPVFAQEGGPFYFGGVYQMTLGFLKILDDLTEAFRTGEGVPQSAYPSDVYAGMERFTAGWFENLLLPVWIAAVPDVQAALEKGIDVCDVGCGQGRALTKLAEAFPASRFVGYDIFEPVVNEARANAEAAGVADKVRFEVRDVAKGIPDQFDLITTFDVIHDSADPLGMLKVVHEALRPDGSYLCLDINCSDKLEENVGPLGAFLYGASMLYCMTTSLAQGGAALGTLGLHEKKLQELATEAGYSSCRKLPIEDPFNNLYELKP